MVKEMKLEFFDNYDSFEQMKPKYSNYEEYKSVFDSRLKQDTQDNVIYDGVGHGWTRHGFDKWRRHKISTVIRSTFTALLVISPYLIWIP